MRFWMILSLAALVGCTAAPEKGPIPVSTSVSAAQSYEYEGVTYWHLWSPGMPKSVLVIEESRIPKHLLTELRRLENRDGVRIAFKTRDGLSEAPTYLNEIAPNATLLQSVMAETNTASR